MARPKLPTGESPKKLSPLASAVKSKAGVKPSAAAARAGSVRDTVAKAGPMGKADALGLARQKAMAPAKKSDKLPGSADGVNFKKPAKKTGK